MQCPPWQVCPVPWSRSQDRRGTVQCIACSKPKSFVLRVLYIVLVFHAWWSGFFKLKMFLVTFYEINRVIINNCVYVYCARSVTLLSCDGHPSNLIFPAHTSVCQDWGEEGCWAKKTIQRKTGSGESPQLATALITSALYFTCMDNISLLLPALGRRHRKEKCHWQEKQPASSQ